MAAALLALLCHAGVAHAAGLGGIKVLSRLGQPFAAEIELINVSRDDLSTLNASLAPAAAYQAANLSFDPVLNALRLSVERRANGTPYIRATAARRVTEPYLDLLVEITSRDGRIQRQYTALLDLPDLAERASPASAPVAAVPAVAALNPDAIPPRSPSGAARTPLAAPAPTTAIAPAPAVVARTAVTPATRVPEAPATAGINTVAPLASKAGESAKSDAAKSELPKPAPAPATADPAPAAMPKAEPIKSESKEPALVPPPQASVPAVKKEVASPSPPKPQQGLFDGLMNQLAWIGGGLLALLLALGGLWALRRRRQESAAAAGLAVPSPSEPLLGAESVAAAATVNGMNDASAARNDVTPVEPTVANAADTVDAIDEAKVYLEYGQDEPAEKLLREALSKQPGREDVQMLLLEILAGRGDKDGFNPLAGRLHKQTGGVGGNWKRAMAMGYALDPGYPLYSPTGNVASADDAATQAPQIPSAPVTDIELESAAPDKLSSTSDILLDISNEGLGMDKTMVLTRAETAPVVPAVEPLPDLQFELATISAPVRDALPASAPAVPAAKADTGLDFNIDFGALKPVVNDAPAVPAAVTPAAVPAAMDYAQLEEVQQKIDLTRAYLEMGDKEAALELLHEIEREGSVAQKSEAQEILKSLD